LTFFYFWSKKIKYAKVVIPITVFRVSFELCRLYHFILVGVFSQIFHFVFDMSIKFSQRENHVADQRIEIAPRDPFFGIFLNPLVPKLVLEIIQLNIKLRVCLLNKFAFFLMREPGPLPEHLGTQVFNIRKVLLVP
jgi:hypothetical protein